MHISSHKYTYMYAYASICFCGYVCTCLYEHAYVYISEYIGLHFWNKITQKSLQSSDRGESLFEVPGMKDKMNVEH